MEEEVMRDTDNQLSLEIRLALIEQRGHLDMEAVNEKLDLIIGQQRQNTFLLSGNPENGTQGLIHRLAVLELKIAKHTAFFRQMWMIVSGVSIAALGTVISNFFSKGH